MEKIFDTIYLYISTIGLLPKKLGQALFVWFKKFPIRVIAFTKALVRSFTKSKKSAILIVVAIAVLTVAGGVCAYIITNNSYKTNAVLLSYDDKPLGYAASEKDADLAKANARITLSASQVDNIVFDTVKTDACNISDPKSLCDTIVNTLKTDLIEVSEVYIGNTFICAVKDTGDARSVVNKAIDVARKTNPQQAVSFAQSIVFKPAYYKSDENIASTEQLRNILQDPQKLSTQKTQYLETISYTNFETVEIQSNKLFVGDSRVKRTGKNGSEYKVSLVKTIDGAEVFTKHLMSVPIEEPITQIVERGIRAQSLVMDTYSVVQTLGVFCWPCVNLFEVTSPFGERELNSENDNHQGIDISGPNAAGCLVVAGAGGTVTEAGYNTGGYGNYVIINHGNGIETLYAHMLDNSLQVRAGDRVEKGEVIGQVGNTGYSFGAHLHFEVRINGVKVNPAPYLGLQ